MTFVKLLTVWFYKLNRNFINVVYESLQMYRECDFSADLLISVDLEIEMFSLEINTDQWLNDFLLFLLLSFTSLHNVFWNSFKFVTFQKEPKLCNYNVCWIPNRIFLLQPGKKSLLLKEIIADNASITPASVGSSSKREIGQSVKRKHMSMAQQSRMDRERENAILLYRQQKQRKLNPSWRIFIFPLFNHFLYESNQAYCVHILKVSVLQYS